MDKSDSVVERAVANKIPFHTHCPCIIDLNLNLNKEIFNATLVWKVISSRKVTLSRERNENKNHEYLTIYENEKS